MILELKDNNIEITEESTGESFIKIQENSKYSLAPRLRHGKFQVPLIALGIVTNICKALKIPVKLGPELRANVARLKEERQTLESIKAIDENASLPFQLEKIGIIQGDDTLTNGQKQMIHFGLTGKHVLIASEVGTGKTLAVNSICKTILNKNPKTKILIVTQSSLVENYYNDYIKFFGNQGIVKISKGMALCKRFEIYKIFMSRNDINILCINYEKFNFDYEMLKSLRPNIVVVDEAHNFKNHLSAKRSVNFFKLIELYNPEWRFALTGCCIENKIFDIYPIFKFLDGGRILGGENFFSSNFVEYETVFFKIKMKTGQTMTRTEQRAVGFKNHDFLKSLIRPYIIRVKSKLPIGIYEENIKLTMSSKVKDVYEMIKNTPSNISEKYHKLRQFLNSTDVYNIDENKKLDKLDEILDQTSEKILIFSYYKCTLKTIKDHLTKKAIKCLTYSGDDEMSPIEMIEKFKDPNVKVLVATDRLSTGCNIQFCNFLIQWDMPVKPSISIQRIGRIYRLGQQKDVHVFNFITDDSIESIIFENFTRKKLLINEMIENLDIEYDEIEQSTKQKIVEYLK